MKRIVSTLIAICLFAFMQACMVGYICTRPKVEDGKLNGILPLKGDFVEYSEVVSAPGLSKEEVYRRARRWMAKHYRSSKGAIEMEDRITGDLVSNSRLGINQVHSTGYVYLDLHFSLSVESKADKFRIEITGISVERALTSNKSVMTASNSEVPIEQYCQGKRKDVDQVFRVVDSRLKTVTRHISESIKNHEEF
jgi:hypothetical protein